MHDPASTHPYHEWRAVHWIIFPALAAVTLVLGVSGHAGYARDHGLPASFTSGLYMTLQLFILHAPHLEPPIDWRLNAARFLAVGILGYGAGLTLLSGFGRFLRVVGVRTWRDHVVIAGSGEEALLLARDFLAAKDRVVVVAGTPGSALEEIHRMGGAVLIGGASDGLFRGARLDRARNLIATTGDDGASIEFATRVAGWLGARGERAPTRPLECSIHLGDATLRSAIRRDRSSLPDAGGRMRVEIVGLDLFENSARLLFDRHPLDHAPIAEGSPRRIHLVICYFGQMGEAVLLQAARIGVFANGLRPRLTVLHSQTWLEPHRSDFLRRHPAVTELCELEFMGCDASDPDLVPKLAKISRSDEVVSFTLCEPHDAHNLALAIRLVEATPNERAPVLLRMRSRRGLTEWLEQRGGAGRFGGRLHAFGMIEDICTRDQLLRGQLDTLARRIHEEFVTRRRAEAVRPAGDPSLADWERLGDDFKESNRQQADHIPVKLRALGLCAVPASAGLPPAASFTTDQVELLARMEHARWLVERRLAGWTWVPKESGSDKTRRESSALLPWEELDEPTRNYDRQAVLTIPRVLGAAGLAISRGPVGEGGG